MSSRGKKPIVISVSESEEEEVVFISESDNDDDEDEEEEEEGEESDDDDDDEEDRDEDSEWSAEEEEDETDLDSGTEKDEDSGSKNVPLDDRAQYDLVIELLNGGGDLQSLKLEECKAYLRKHDLRLSGTKAVCIQRIQEHWRIKDGGEKLYPRSSFIINCTGDVCKGDVVVFKQRVYEKFDKVTRNGKVLGKRTIAGRVVKESYGAAAQQHTFTVEVLWSKGVKKLPPLFPLLVKGRNLYRLKTFRQRWDNETERSKVLSEKHKRGAAARQLRAMKKAHTANGVAKRQKHSHHTKRSPKRRRKEESQPAAKVFRKHVPARGEAFNFSDHDIGSTSTVAIMPHPRPYPTGMINQVPMRYAYTNPGYQFDPRSMKHLAYNASIDRTGMQLNNPRDISRTSHPNRGAVNFSSHDIGTTSTATTMPPLRHYPTGMINQVRYAYTNPGHQFYPRSMNHLPYNASIDKRLNSVPSGAERFRGVNYGSLHCSTPGCRDQRDENCVVFSCWRCCRRTGRKCHRHQ